jgi:hypothetical protein
MQSRADGNIVRGQLRALKVKKRVVVVRPPMSA